MAIPPSLRFIFVAILVVAVTLLSGCSHMNLSADARHECPENGAIDWTTGERFDPEGQLRPSAKPIVKLVELTDDGELHDRCQWSDVLYEIRGNQNVEGQGDLPKFVVIYVHGWKHDSSRNDTDLMRFSRLIQKLTNAQDELDNKADVIGVYVAWPGASIKVPGLDNLSFWGRKGAADRVAIAGNLSKLVSSIVSIRHQRGNPDDFIVALGHSFGARILFSATSPLLIHELQMNHPGKRRGRYGAFQAPIDLTVLLNPAFEASRYTAIDSTRRWQESFADIQQPVLLTISTTSDMATKLAFPIGQIIGTRLSERERTTLGNYKEYFTHELRQKSLASGKETRSYTWYDSYCESTLCLERATNDLQPGNPFLVAITSDDVLSGHNGIWSNPFQEWLMAFIHKTKEEIRNGGK